MLLFDFPCFSDSSDYYSTSSSHVDSGIGDSSNRLDPDCESLSSQNSFSKLEDSVLGKCFCVLEYSIISCQTAELCIV